MPRSSTSKMRVESAGITGGNPRAPVTTIKINTTDSTQQKVSGLPYPRAGAIVSLRFSPMHILQVPHNSISARQRKWREENVLNESLVPSLNDLTSTKRELKRLVPVAGRIELGPSRLERSSLHPHQHQSASYYLVIRAKYSRSACSICPRSGT